MIPLAGIISRSFGDIRTWRNIQPLFFKHYKLNISSLDRLGELRGTAVILTTGTGSYIEEGQRLPNI